MENNLFNVLTKDRYNFKNSFTSFKFIDFIVTDLLYTTDELKKINKQLESEKHPLSNSLFNKLYEIIKDTFSLIKYEIDNPYVFHKVVPSARNIHPNECYLVYLGNILRFNPKSNRLQYVSYNSKYKDHIYICVVSELWRIMKFYGQIGLALSLLDAGHILGNLKILMDYANLGESEVYTSFNKGELIKDLSLCEKSMFLNYIIDLGKYAPKDCNFKIDLKISATRSINYAEEVASYNNIAEFIFKSNNSSIFESHKITNKELELKEKLDLKKIIDVMPLRQSAHSNLGTFSTLNCLDSQCIREIINSTMILVNRYVNKSHRFKIYFLFKGKATGEIKSYVIQNRAIYELPSKDIELHKVLHDSHNTINIESCPVVSFVSYETKVEDEGEAIYTSHIGASEISQYISNIVAKHGLFARPMKNFDDSYLQFVANIPKDKEQIMYLTMIGRSNCINYRLNL